MIEELLQESWNFEPLTNDGVMSSPEKRQFVWNRRLAQLDDHSQIDSVRSEGGNRFAALMIKLFSMGMTLDAEKATNDPIYRGKLYAQSEIM